MVDRCLGPGQGRGLFVEYKLQGIDVGVALVTSVLDLSEG
jgi:hypothetical protein